MIDESGHDERFVDVVKSVEDKYRRQKDHGFAWLQLMTQVNPDSRAGMYYMGVGQIGYDHKTLTIWVKHDGGWEI